MKTAKINNIYLDYPIVCTMFQVLLYFFERILTYCNLKDDGVEWLLTVKKAAVGSGSLQFKFLELKLVNPVHSNCPVGIIYC